MHRVPAGGGTLSRRVLLLGLGMLSPHHAEGRPRKVRVVGNEPRNRSMPKRPRKSTKSVHWPKREAASKLESDALPLTVQTIHSAKGETHDVTIHYVPKLLSSGKGCPYKEWWRDDPELSEERRLICSSDAVAALVRSVSPAGILVSAER
jgi:hypothetical protein